MRRYPILFGFLLFFLASFSLSAQQSSKTKAANKLYEKGVEVKVDTMVMDSIPVAFPVPDTLKMSGTGKQEKEAIEPKKNDLPEK